MVMSGTEAMNWINQNLSRSLEPFNRSSSLDLVIWSTLSRSSRVEGPLSWAASTSVIMKRATRTINAVLKNRFGISPSFSPSDSAKGWYSLPPEPPDRNRHFSRKKPPTRSRFSHSPGPPQGRALGDVRQNFEPFSAPPSSLLHRSSRNRAPSDVVPPMPYRVSALLSQTF